MELKELVAECKEYQSISLAVYKDTRYSILGYYYTTDMTMTEFNELTNNAWNEHIVRLELALYHLAEQSNDPLVQWIAHNVPNKQTAFHLIKRLPMDLEQIDRFAQRNKWCQAYYNRHRPAAVAAKVVFEYKE